MFPCLYEPNATLVGIVTLNRTATPVVYNTSLYVSNIGEPNIRMAENS
jgi:hypothetical protein